MISFFTMLASAFSRFDTNCTLPATQDRVNYVSSPNTRGTLSIVWSCLFTIIACTWTVQHPSLPWQRKHYYPDEANFSDPRLKAERKWKISKWKHAIAWFLGTIFAPEVPLAKHLGDLWEVRRMQDEIKNAAKEKGYEPLSGWRDCHYLFALMGGFAMRTNEEQNPTAHGNHNPTTEAGISAAPGGEDSIRSISEPKLAATEDKRATDLDHATKSEMEDYPRILSLTEIKELLEAGILTHLPEIDETDIMDKSKKDNLLKVIAVSQILWLCIQVISRAVGNLAVSQLEIATVAYALCAVIIYGLAWKKPKGVEVPITILQLPDRGSGFGKILSPERKPTDQLDLRKYFGDQIWKSIKKGETKQHFNGDLTDTWRYILATAISTGTLFGAVHLAAWNCFFPTHTEKLLWRAAALYCTCFPLGNVSLILFPARVTIYQNIELLLSFVWLLSNAVFVLARLYLIVEMFRTLAFQPTGAFVGTWSVNMPNIS
ncbi:uncharacterized protein BP01DRAFT_302083 [Aspergillus saccharolyticus JOP 1030-1]|uniref:Uncharacterized protein n=1 Tax=Aspergillus saccharolyticus JOP 1030-1 TaxID=1450539 RepID=A0A318Z989_9EURO|nr:hypothetical protein BP01DRAFT_302083 [Aspergillus saccharolyticus JOP 1030-1]PYH42967.1 hypothetical protein BP01DRAFT_302083 [Aspergillus saccharolyticus JOP 1030-1]